MYLITAITLVAAKALTGQQELNPEFGTPRMVLLNGGQFLMGTASQAAYTHAGHRSESRATGLQSAATNRPGGEDGADDERPVHQATLSPFYIDATEVTNAEFARLCKALATTPMRRGKVFLGLHERPDGLGAAIQGADWRHPIGPDSTVTDKMDAPVVNVSWGDAVAYASWVRKRLPTEAE